MKKKTFW